MQNAIVSMFVTLVAVTVVRAAEPPHIVKPKFDGWERVSAGEGFDLYKYYPDTATGDLAQVLRDVGKNVAGRQNNHFALVVDYRTGHLEQVMTPAQQNGFATWPMKQMWEHASAMPGRKARVLVSGTYFTYADINYGSIDATAVPTFGLKVNGAIVHRGIPEEINRFPNRKNSLRMISFQNGSAEIIPWDNAAFDDRSKTNLVSAIGVAYQTDGDAAGRHLFGLVNNHTAVHLLSIEMKLETAVRCLAGHFGVDKSKMVQLDGGRSVRVVADEKVRLPVAGLSNAAINRLVRDLPHMLMISD